MRTSKEISDELIKSLHNSWFPKDALILTLGAILETLLDIRELLKRSADIQASKKS